MPEPKAPRHTPNPIPTHAPSPPPGATSDTPRDPGAILPDRLPAPFTPPAGFLDAARALGVEFEPGETERLGSYLALLDAANQSMNLTAVRDPDAAWTRHILDSLSLLPMLAELEKGSRVIDVGSGGGLPGIPLAICLPHLRFTLLEATGKKAAFLTRAVQLLGLKNTSVVADRAERFARWRESAKFAPKGSSPSGRASFDAVLARAVGRLPLLLELTVPLAKLHGRVLLIKGEKAEEELAEAAGALRALKAVHAATIPTPTGRVVVIEKPSETPRVYPRPDGEPSRRPLGVVAPPAGGRPR